MHKGHSKSSKLYADFIFIEHLLFLNGSHLQKLEQKSELVFLIL